MRNLIVVALLLVGSVAKANEPIVSLPFEIHLGHIYIKGQINDGRPINIVFDTGAAANLASEEVADEIGITTAGTQTVMGASGPVSIKASTNNLLMLGEELELKNQRFLVMNLDHLGDPDYPLDAIIGANILNRYTVEMDFEKGLINLFPRNGFTAPEGYEAHSISLAPFNIPIIEGSLIVSDDETVTGPYLVDTGAALALRINTPTVNENELVEKVTPNYEHSGRALNNSSIDKVGRLKSFTVLGESFEGVPIRMASVTTGVSSMSNVNGILGLEILKRFNTIYDYKKQVMYTKKNSLFNAPYRENKSGLKLKKRQGYLEVENVIASSAAEKAAIKSGDRILSVDGKKGMTHDECQAYLSSVKGSVTLEIMRNGKKLSVSLKPAFMI
ncbi:aspartyl protease family protein [Roseivirga sp. E12]|uniref:aspartyl protease family protein n=1 Tax=Roseivirga sp. E12 TaxID=2819237 RepID=UPI001ABC8732|nr:aspartyl protease family protein [Roseivirga sp. E12]MBO3698741.1 aspartyl protease family protein [Roseivirga sp. E12]